MQAGFQLGFVTGEIGAVRLVPPGPGTYQLTRVTLLFGGGGGMNDVTLRVWVDEGNDAPGTQLYTGDYTLTASDTAFSEIDLRPNSVFVSGPFRIGIEFNHDGAPSIARDDDGTISAPNNFIFAQGLGWAQSQLFGLTGDWVIRATVDDGLTGEPDAGPGTPDAGPDVPDAGPDTPDAGTGDQCQVHSECPTGQYCGDDNACTYDCRIDTDCDDDNLRCTSLGRCEALDGDGGGGCGCSSPGARASSMPLWAGLLAILCVAALRRRRRQ